MQPVVKAVLIGVCRWTMWRRRSLFPDPGATSAPRSLMQPSELSSQQIEEARSLIESGKESRATAAALFGVDVTTLRRALNEGSM